MSSKRLAKMIKGVGSLTVNIIILAFVASWIFGINIWFVSTLSIVQIVLLCIAISIISKGISKIIEPVKSKDYDDNQWHRWENYDYDQNDTKGNSYEHEIKFKYSYGQSPPPPPPPNGSFSDYDPNENKTNNSTHSAEGHFDAKINKEHYKEQAKHFANQAKQFAYDTKRYAEQKSEEVQKYFNQSSEYSEIENRNNYKGSQYSNQQYNDSNHYSNHEHEEHYDHYKQYRSQYDTPNTIYHNMFIGDFKFKESYTQLSPLEINGFITDAHIDLTRVEIPYGETVIRLNCFIGDMKVHVPNDPRIGVRLVIASFIGDGKLFDQKRGGFVLNTALETPFYHECERKISIHLNCFIGDAKVKRVG